MNDGLVVREENKVSNLFCNILLQIGQPYTFRPEKISGVDCIIVTFSIDDGKKINFVVTDNGEGWFEEVKEAKETKENRENNDKQKK